MPICKNDNSKTYTGNEPSPKGLGYCAHNEKLYTIMEGLDNNYWYVSPIGKSRRWKHLKIPTEWFQDIKKIKSKTITKITKGKNYNDIFVLHIESNNVYRNKAFEKEIKSITKLNFNFSEQGLQEIHKAHMELDNISIIKLIKKYLLHNTK